MMVGMTGRLLIIALLVVPIGSATAQSSKGADVGADERPAADAPAPKLGLDRLLRVPSTAGRGQLDVRGGRDRAGWQAEFREVRREIRELEASIATTQQKLRESSSEEWGFTPSGAGGPPTDPEVLKLRTQLKRDRASLEAAQERSRELEIEAALAGVPDSWKKPPPEADDVAP
jgi:hypothetical protein